MEVEPEHARQRRPRVSLTRRQREVLARIADGKTNGEIAEELGISLDGVKYHVREICDFVGVDTREEAAEWWRQQHGMRARFAVVRHGLARMPALVRWGLAGGAALAVAGAAIFAMWPSEDDREGLDPGVWVALTVPVEPDGPSAWFGQLRLINVATGEERDIGEPAAWYWPSLSPSGERLYALEVREGPVRNVLHLFNLESGKDVQVPWERRYAPERAVWSPDGTRLSIASTEWAGVMLPDGTVTGEAFRPEPETGTAAADVCTWTPDSTLYLCYAAKQGDWAVIVDRSGKLFAFLEGSSIAPPPLDTQLRLAMSTHFAWAEANHVDLVASTQDESGRNIQTWRLTGDLDPQRNTVTWSAATELTQTEASTLEERLLARQQKLANAHGVPGGSISSIGTSHDGEFAGAFVGVSTTASSSQAGREFTFVTFANGERFAYSLGYQERAATIFLFIAWDMVRVR